LWNVQCAIKVLMISALTNRAAVPPEDVNFYIAIFTKGEIESYEPLVGRSFWVLGRKTPDPCQIKNTHEVCDYALQMIPFLQNFLMSV